MKVNFNVNVIDFNGAEVKVNDKVVVMSDELCKIMFFAGTGDTMSNDQKYNAYKIGRKIANNEQEYTAEELAFIKDQAGKSLAAGVYGFLIDTIEGNIK